MPTTLPPITSIRDFMAFEEHVRNARARRGLEVPAEWYEAPTFYFSCSAPGVLFGDGDVIPKPSYTERLDIELEIACVIGTGGRDIAAADAEAHIAGYTIFNDWSARDVQRREMAVGLGPCKAKDFAQSLGPHLVTPAELEPYRTGPGRFDLAASALVNGVTITETSSRDMQWSFCELIEFASQAVELQPGDVIGSGTLGRGCLLELGQDVHRWLEVGDEVTLTVEGIGSLTNTVG